MKDLGGSGLIVFVCWLCFAKPLPQMFKTLETRCFSLFLIGCLVGLVQPQQPQQATTTTTNNNNNRTKPKPPEQNQTKTKGRAKLLGGPHISQNPPKPTPNQNIEKKNKATTQKTQKKKHFKNLKNKRTIKGKITARNKNSAEKQQVDYNARP